MRYSVQWNESGCLFFHVYILFLHFTELIISIIIVYIYRYIFMLSKLVGLNTAVSLCECKAYGSE